MRDGLRNASEAWQGIKVSYFNVSYVVNSSYTAPLPGIFITPDANQKLPLIIVGAGFDWPKEVRICLCFPIGTYLL